MNTLKCSTFGYITLNLVHCTKFHWIECFALHYTELSALHYNTLHWVHCTIFSALGALHYTELSALHYIAVHDIALHYIVVHWALLDTLRYIKWIECIALARGGGWLWLQYLLIYCAFNKKLLVHSIILYCNRCTDLEFVATVATGGRVKFLTAV